MNILAASGYELRSLTMRSPLHLPSNRSLPIHFPIFLWGMLVAFLAIWPRGASAQTAGAATSSGSPPVVVDVARDEPELDPALVRSAIAAELGRPAIAPDDARAAQASGSIQVAVDRGARALVVSYTEKPAAITRRIALPADPAATARAAMLLAGNLARNEGEELAASLRPPKSQPAPATTGEDVGDALALDRLGEALQEAQVGATRRRVAQAMLMGAGIGAGAPARR